MTVTKFEEVSRWGQKNVKCAGCGKHLRRSTTITNTINPFNKNAAGQVKSYGEVLDNVKAQLEAWKLAPERCKPCEVKAKEAEKLRQRNAPWGVYGHVSPDSGSGQAIVEGFVKCSYLDGWFDDEVSARAAYGAYENDRIGNTYVALLRRAAPGAGWDVEEYREVEPRKATAGV